MYFYAKTKKNSRDFSFSANYLATVTQWNGQCETLVKFKRKIRIKNRKKNIRKMKENMLRQQKKERNDI